MPASTDLVEVQPTAEELALLQQQEAEFDDAPLITPILKIGQQLTREVQAGDAEVGEFINTLTGEALGDAVTFIVSYYNQGRFAADRKTGRAYSAFSADIPETWADFVGEEFVGTPFVEYPDAEEVYKARVNAKEIEWGHGPKVSTTHNYTGLVILPAAEGEEGDELQPVRLSLKRTDNGAVRKFNSLKRMSLRNKPFWEITFDLTTFKKEFKQGTSYLLALKPGRKTTADEREEAKNLALAVVGGRAVANDDGQVDPEAAEPDTPKSALAV